MTLLPGIRAYREITGNSLTIVDGNGQTVSLSADTVVIAAGARGNSALFSEMEGQAFEKCLIGDAAEPRNIMDAMEDAALVAYRL